MGPGDVPGVRLPVGDFHHKKSGRQQYAARGVFLRAIAETKPEVLLDLMTEVAPFYECQPDRSWRSEYERLVAAQYLPNSYTPSAEEKRTLEFTETLFEWCRRWRFPPNPSLEEPYLEEGYTWPLQAAMATLWAWKALGIVKFSGKPCWTLPPDLYRFNPTDLVVEDPKGGGSHRVEGQWPHETWEQFEERARGALQSTHEASAGIPRIVVSRKLKEYRAEMTERFRSEGYEKSRQVRRRAGGGDEPPSEASYFRKFRYLVLFQIGPGEKLAKLASEAKIENRTLAAELKTARLLIDWPKKRTL